MPLDDASQSFRFLIRDHDRTFSRAFATVFDAAGMQILTTPVPAPRANAIAERFVGSLRRELLDRILILNPRQAAGVLAEYQQHFNELRPHRSLSPSSTAAAAARTGPEPTPPGRPPRPARPAAPRIHAGRIA